jgi:uncharacterized protein (TIGR03437 family)
MHYLIRILSAPVIFTVLLLGPTSAASAQNISLRGQISPFPGPLRYADVWGEGNFAYLASFNGTGVMIIDISDPGAPVLAGYYNPNEGGRFQDVIVVNGIGFFASESGGGVHVVDVRSAQHPVLLSQIGPSMGGFSLVHELAFSDGLLYEADSRTTVVKVFDVANPTSPFLLRNIQTTDTFFIHAVTVINGRLYTSGWSGRTDIWDVKTIRSSPPTMLGSVFTGDRSHSSSVSNDGKLLVSARETVNGDIRIFDISDPSQPLLKSNFTAQSFGKTSFSAHNPYIVGNLLFVSWYQAGLLVIDIKDPSAPRFLGGYDTFDEGTGGINGYEGAWGVFPFLGLDRVLVSDLDRGLFILDTTAAVPLPRITSAASFSQSAISPRAIVTSFGSGMTNVTSAAGVLPLPTSLGATTVSVVDSRGVERLAPLFYVSPTQINYQIPTGTVAGPAIVIIRGSDGTVSMGSTIVKSVAPAIFTTSQTGDGAAAAIDGYDGSLAPFAAKSVNGSPNIIAVFASGLGEDATDVDGNIASGVEALIDGQQVPVLYAGRAPGYAGLNQINVMFPNAIIPGTHTLIVRRNGIASRLVTVQTR